MAEFIESPPAQIVIGLAVIFALIAVGVYVVLRFRDRADGEESLTADVIENFREMHGQGDLSDDEYRTIKTVLAMTLQEELKDNGEKG